MRSPEGEAGYTLLELLVVLVVLGLLVAVATPQVMRMLSGAKSDAAKLQIASLKTALEYYQLDVGIYPTTEQGLKALTERPAEVEGWNGPYIQKDDHAVDPWGKPYRYESPGKRTATFDIYTLGADAKAGGEGDDADVGNWK